MKVSEPPIVVEQIYPTNRETIWKAITEHSQMVKWYFDNLPDFQPEVGFETHFLIENEGRQFTHLWKITEVIPFQKITYSWQFKEWEGSSTSCFELIENGDSTTLRVTCEVLEDFPEGVPEFERASCEGGWQYFLGERLSGYFEGDKFIK